jgi:hypothetical protein
MGASPCILVAGVDGGNAAQALFVEERMSRRRLIVGSGSRATQLLANRLGQGARRTVFSGTAEAECADEERQGSETSCKSTHGQILSLDSSCEGPA